MPYSLFLILFIVPPMLVFGYLMRRRMNKRLYLSIGASIFLAVTYTTPWDNYLVATRVWYYDPRLVFGITFGYVPIEEYSFFVLQTLLSSFFMLYLWRRLYPADWGDIQEVK
jgi:lycopene cyclase domain-containing protein